MTLIKREDAIEAVLTYFIPRSHTGERGEHEEDFVRTIFKALPSAELTLQTPQTYGKSINPSNAEVVEDYISRADAIEAVCKAVCEDDVSIFPECDQIKYCDEIQALLALPSSEVKPTVIRSKTLLPTKDFKEWAKRIREVNSNAVVIPCDAEVVSAEAVQGEWEFVDNEIFAGEYFCSVCGKRAEVDLYGEWILSNFCPSCGARMLREDVET